jgi:NAD(P)-dependent dehydrogenase (short-subunit alcohol dehydrogenase family)
MLDLKPVPVPDLTGKVVFVTGAGRGIGAALVGLLCERGARVFAGIHRDGGDEPDALPVSAVKLPLDVTDPAAVAAAIATVGGTSGRLDVLVNNAGIISPIAHLADLPSVALGEAIAVNVIGMHRMIVAALPLLKATGGRIINAGTGAATTPLEGWTGYCVSKAGARMLTLVADLELRPEGVRCFFLGIPPTDTVMQQAIRESGLNPISRIPRGDLLKPIVPASVMAYLCGPAAAEISDVVLDVRDERFKAMMMSGSRAKG